MSTSLICLKIGVCVSPLAKEKGLPNYWIIWIGFFYFLLPFQRAQSRLVLWTFFLALFLAALLKTLYLLSISLTFLWWFVGPLHVPFPSSYARAALFPGAGTLGCFPACPSSALFFQGLYRGSQTEHNRVSRPQIPVLLQPTSLSWILPRITQSSSQNKILMGVFLKGFPPV